MSPRDKAVRWGVVLGFLGLVFVLTWGSIYGQQWVSATLAAPEAGWVPVGMFMPAAVALVLRLFFLEDSALFHRSYREPPRWIAHGFLGLVAFQCVVAGFAFGPWIPQAILRGMSGWAMILWTLLIIFLYRKHGGESFRRGGLQLGNTDLGAWFVVGFALFFLIQSGLNLALGLSDLDPRADSLYGFSVPGNLYWVALVPAFVLSAVGTPLGNLALVFGEEYAWRGFLQDELSGLGRLPASLLIGLIWGIWHIPIILSGVHTYPPNLVGISLGLGFFSLWGIIQSYAVFKIGSVWAAAFLHGVVNGVYAFLRTYVERPDDKVFSFGLGLYGILCLAVVVLMVLRDPLWREGTPPSAVPNRASVS